MALVTNVVKGSDATRLLLLLHGYGADERDLGGLLPYLDPDGTFAAVLPAGRSRRRARRASPGTTSAATPPRVRTHALEELDALVDEQCDGARICHARGDLRRLLAGRRARARARAARAVSSARPAGVLAMSPALALGRSDVDARAVDVPVLVQHGTHDPLIPVQRSRDLARALRDAGRPDRVPRVPDGAPGRDREPAATRRSGSRRCSRANGPTSRCPRIPVELVPSVTTAQFDAEVLRSDVAGDRRLLGAVVRTVPAGVADRRDDRRDAPGLLQGREGQHRRRAARSRSSTTCRASR